jgi:hypothetical protein
MLQLPSRVRGMALAPPPTTVTGACGGPCGGGGRWSDRERKVEGTELALLGWGQEAASGLWRVACGGGGQSRASGMGWYWRGQRW